MHGHGIFNWWGFSPAVNMLNYVSSNCEEDKPIQILMIGSGDPRHIIKMLAARKTFKKIRIYILEAHIEIYSRMILLLGVCLRHGLGVMERANLLLDLWGNLTLRPTSRQYLESAAREYALIATDSTQYERMVSLVSAAKLKYRERDAMDDTFRSWYSLKSHHYKPTNVCIFNGCRDVRLRQLFKTRYDNRIAEADWAWHMRLSPRIEHCFNLPQEAKNGEENKTSCIHKTANNDNVITCSGKNPTDEETPSQDTKTVKDISRSAYEEKLADLDDVVGVCKSWQYEFLEWRQTGHAFNVGVEAKSDLPNSSLASVAIIPDGTKQLRRVGYWGDLLTGPFPALALASSSKELIKQQNGRSKYSGTEVALWHLENMVKCLWENEEINTEEGALGKKGSCHTQESEKLEEAFVNTAKSQDQDKIKNSTLIAIDQDASSEDGPQNTETFKDAEKIPSEQFAETKQKSRPLSEDISAVYKSEIVTSNSEKVLPELEENTSKSMESNQSQNLENMGTFSSRASQSTIKHDAPHNIPYSNSYLKLQESEVIFISPTRLKNLDLLSEVYGDIDILYLSAATAHLLTPNLAKMHLTPHSILIVETARMMPELTDAQVIEYEKRVFSSATEAGWEVCSPAPICHLCFKRKVGFCKEE